MVDVGRANGGEVATIERRDFGIPEALGNGDDRGISRPKGKSSSSDGMSDDPPTLSTVF